MNKNETTPYNKDMSIQKINSSIKTKKQLHPKYVSTDSISNINFLQTSQNLTNFKQTCKTRSSWNLKYSSIEELEIAIDDFFDFILTNNMYPTIELLCVWLDVSRETLNRIENNPKDFRCDTVKKAKEKIIAMLTQHLLSKTGNPAGNIFHLKALFGLTETSNIVVNASNNTFDVTKPKNADEILAALPETPEMYISNNFGN